MSFFTLGVIDTTPSARRWDHRRLPEKASVVHIDLGHPGSYIALDVVEAKKLIEDLTAVVADIEANPAQTAKTAAEA